MRVHTCIHTCMHTYMLYIHTVHALSRTHMLFLSLCRCDVEVDPQPQQGYISSWFRSKKSLGYKPDMVSAPHSHHHQHASLSLSLSFSLSIYIYMHMCSGTCLCIPHCVCVFVPGSEARTRWTTSQTWCVFFVCTLYSARHAWGCQCATFVA